MHNLHTTQELAGFRIGFFLQQKWQQKRGVGEEKEEELEENGREECVHLLLLLRLHKKGLELHISWQENRKQEIMYQEISCRKRAFSQEISWLCQNWPKNSLSI